MKARATLFASMLLFGCQATNQDALQLTQVDQNLSSASHFFTTTSQVDNINWLMNDDGLTEKNIWKVVSEELKMEIPENDRIRVQQDYYLNHKSYIHDVTLRAEPYMYWIISQIKERDMPMELVLLPIVESAFNPNATSSARAAGLWQIVPTTGLYYGLKQDKWYDGRRDVAESTTAALDMLARLNTMFNGDWLQTIAAYNCGEGRVLRAIEDNEARGLPTDYWSLNLPKETSLYVPKLLALSDMIKNQDRYEISLPDSTITRALTRIEVGQQIELTQAARMSGMPLQKLKTYNAGYKHNITAPDGPHSIMLPINNAKQLKKSLDNGELSLVNWGKHRVVNGETVEILAKRYGITAQDIRLVNNLTVQVTSGQIITLPISSEYISQIAKQHTQVVKNSSKHAISKTKYTIRKGDSLTSIAKRHKLDINDVLDWNSTLTDVHNLQPGDTLTLYKR